MLGPSEAVFEFLYLSKISNILLMVFEILLPFTVLYLIQIFFKPDASKQKVHLQFVRKSFECSEVVVSF